MSDTNHSSSDLHYSRADKTKLSFRSKRGQEFARNILALCIIIIALYTLQNFLPALVWGCIFAVATWPLYSKACQRWPKAAKGVVLPFIFTLIVSLLFLVPLILLTMEAIREAQSALIWLAEMHKSGMPVPEIVRHLPFGASSLSGLWEKHLSDPRDFSSLIQALDSKGIEVTRAVGKQIAHRGTLFCFSVVTLFFLYKDGKSVIRQCQAVSRRAFGKRGESISRQIVASIHGTVQGLVLVGIGEGVLMWLIYLFAHAPHPALFGVITAVAAMIPFCAIISVTFISLLVMATGATVSAIVIFSIGAVIIFIADHFIRPSLIGGSTKLPFLWVLLGILGGAETWGLIGLFIGPATMAALHFLWKRWASGRPFVIHEH